MHRLEIQREQHLLDVDLSYIVEGAGSHRSAARPLPALELVKLVLALIVEHVAHLMEQIGRVDYEISKRHDMRASDDETDGGAKQGVRTGGCRVFTSSVMCGMLAQEPRAHVPCPLAFQQQNELTEVQSLFHPMPRSSSERHGVAHALLRALL